MRKGVNRENEPGVQRFITELGQKAASQMKDLRLPSMVCHQPNTATSTGLSRKCGLKFECFFWF